MTDMVEMLRGQLAEATDDSVEYACLAGQLARYGVHTPRLDEDVDMNDIAWDDLVDEMANMDEDEPEMALDRLFCFDELCSAAAWLGQSSVAEFHADLVARTIRAFPEAWNDAIAVAGQVLEQCPPVAGDPMRQVWEVLRELTAPTSP